KRCLHLPRGAVPQLEPDYLRWAAPYHAQVVVIFVLGHDGERIQLGILPHLIVARAIQAHRLHMTGAGEQVSQTVDQLGRHVLVEKQFHATATNMLRSRSAAKAKQAWMSSGARYGKSSRIS